MPKRAPTPPPPADDPRHLTVVRPYPHNANMELRADILDFCFWIASCIGESNLIALYHKPSSPSIVIIAVRRDYPEFKKILGEHRWAEFLRKPEPAQAKLVSKVFHCTYGSTREVEKYGWKRIDVKSRWFAKWSCPNGRVVYPYPETHWCPTPVEDPTRSALCRPLPSKDFPPPPPVRLPVVGTPEWDEYKRAQTISKSGRSNPTSPANSDTAPRPAWIKPNVPTNAPPGLPPGLMKPSGSSSSSSSGRGNGWGGPSSSSGTSTPSEGPPISPANDDFAGDVTVIGQRVAGVTFDDPEDDEDEDDYFSVATGAVPVSPLDGPTAVEVRDSLWDDASEDEGGKRAPEILCETHGVVCKRGICRQYASQLREIERAKAREQRELERLQRAAKGKNKGRDRGSQDVMFNRRSQFGGARATTTGAAQAVPRQMPPHLMRGGSTPASPSSPAFAARPSPPADPPLKSPGAARPMPAHLASARRAPAPDAHSESEQSDDTSGIQTGGPWGAIPRAFGGEGSLAGNRHAPPADDDDRRSNSSAGWGTASTGPWGPKLHTKGKTAAAPKLEAEDEAETRSVASAGTGWGTQSAGPWGSVKGGYTKASAPPPPQDDARSVASDGTGWATQSAGPWGSVKGGGNTKAGGAGNAPPPTRPLQDDARSVSSTGTGWGTQSSGPWGSVKGAGNTKTKAPAPGRPIPDDARSATSAGTGWGTQSAGPWGSVAGSAKGSGGNGRGSNAAPTPAEASRPASRAPSAWGSAKGSAKGKGQTPAPAPKKWADYDDDDARSVASAGSGWDAASEGPWSRGAPRAVPQGFGGTQGPISRKMWADERDDLESVASHDTWGNVSAGPW